jgi:aminoglycoside phosphotransferase (APT) family kinase protein
MKIDEAKLITYLSNILPDFTAPLTLKQFSFGQSNPTYFLSDAK